MISVSLEWFRTHKLTILLSFFSIIVVYYLYTRFYGLFSIYNCLTTNFTWKVTNGKLSSCFGPEPTTCRRLDRHGIYGFCYDPDYYGIGVGEPRGPYGYGCTDWIADPEECYPETCELANESKKWGWCVDKNRAYRGNSCGPDPSYGIICEKWIWNDPSRCPRSCPPPSAPKKAPIPSSSSKKQSIPSCPRKKKIPSCPIKKEDECNCE